MQKYYNKKRKLNKLKASLLLLMLVCFAGAATAQTNVYMHSGTQNVTGTLNFYDSGGPSSPDFWWEKWYKHNENSTLVFKNGNNPIKVEFKSFTAYDGNTGANLGTFALRVNNDHLYVYEGESADDSKLICDLTGAIKEEFSIMANGPITFKFVSDGQYRDEGWAATVTSSTSYTVQKPIINKEVCSDYVILYNTANGGQIYYTTDGNDPVINDPLTGATLYNGPFSIDLDAASASVTVKARVKTASQTSAVASHTFTHNDQRPLPGAPTISFTGNMVTMTPAAVPPGLNDTYYVRYTTDGSEPSATNGTVYSEPFEWHTPNTTFKAITQATECPDKISTVVSNTFGDVTVPTPVISFDASGNATITCSFAQASIYYTTNGSEPTTSSSQYTAPFAVTPGTTVKAFAHYGAEHYLPSAVVSKIYVPAGGSGTYNGVVLLDDREDHSWSYYSDGTQPIHSLKPADVKITYKGFGENTMTSTNTDNMPANSAFDTEVEEDQVAVNVGETENQFVYLKTLENDNPEGGENANTYSYTMIPNPFQVRPTYGDGTTTTYTTYEKVTSSSNLNLTQGTYLLVYESGSYAFNGTINNGIGDRTSVSISDGVISNPGSAAVLSLVQAATSGGTTYYYLMNGNTYYGANNNGDLVSLTSNPTTYYQWSVSITNGTLAMINRSATGGNNPRRLVYSSSYYFYPGRSNISHNLSLYKATEHTVTTSDYRGFYAWRVKHLSSGLSIKDGDATLGVGSIIPAETEIEFVTDNAEGNEVEFEALWAKAYYYDATNQSGDLNANVGYERNFVKLGGEGTWDIDGITYPCTVSAYNPDGSNGATSAKVSGEITCQADLKIENIQISGESSTMTANNHDLIIGRGVSGTINLLRGLGENTASNPNYMIRLESGTFNYVSFLKGYLNNQGTSTDGSITISGTVSVKAVLGCDYDRANETNSNLGITYNTFMGNNVTISNTANRNNETFKLTVKSGDIGSSWTINNQFNANAQRCLYMSCASTQTNVGHRKLYIEGGQIASIAGGVDENNQGQNNNDVKSFTIRMTGGHVRGAMYGGGARSRASGNRRFAITGGTITGWLGAGCNGEAGSGSTYAGETYGKSHVYFGGKAICGGTGSNVSINGSLGGIVFGAGKGVQGSTTSGEMTYGTTVVIADECNVERNVYGGGNYGYALANTAVHILGGTVQGSVFGGSNENNGPALTVTMKGGTINENLYGGSNTTGTISGLATINVSGGTVSNVFGGGYGSGTNMAAGTKITVSGGTINNNVYGGGYAGTVTGNTEVNISGGAMKDVYGAGLGTEYNGTTWPPAAANANITGTTTVNVSGGTMANVYGGGENGSVAFNATATSSTGKSTVNVSGGEVTENVFGGGKNGTTQGATIVNVSGGNIRGNVFGGALGAHGRIYVNGMRTVNMTDGHVYGNVYGGSRNANDGNDLSKAENTFNSYQGTEKISVTNISGGIVDQNVYAAGYYGSTFGSVYVFIGKKAIETAPFKEPTTGITYNVTKLSIGGSVWAGGDWGTFSGQFGGSTVSGNSNIYVDGSDYETETTQTSNAQYMNIGGSVLGCGTSCHAGKNDRTIVIRNYGHADGNEPAEATRTLFSIQFAKTLILDNSNINFTGQGRINSLVTTEKYAIYEIANGAITETAPYGIRVINGSGLFLNAPVTQIANYKSMQLKSDYADIYAALNAGGMVDADDFEEVTPSTLPTVANKVRVNNGTYVEVKYVSTTNGTKFGPVIGYTYMMAANIADDATCAYARPRWCYLTQIPDEYNNPNDGGWISYTTTKNTFALDGTSGNVQMPYENHTTRSGEDYFRIWRVGGTEHYREDVFDAAANGTATFSTVDVTITLPAFRAKTNYYRFETTGDGTNTTIDYGPDVLTFNAANYAKPCADGNWMYYDETNLTQVTGVDEDDTNVAFQKALTEIKKNPDVNFGLVAMPGEGLNGSNYIICGDADNNLAKATTKFGNEDNTEQPQVTFRLTYYNKLSSNMTWDPMTIVLVQCDANGNPVDRVTISLAVNTSASIEQEFSTKVYAIMQGKGQTAETFNAKVVLPMFSLYESGEDAVFTLNSVDFESAHNGMLVERGDEYTFNNYAVDYAAGYNYDNTSGWSSPTIVGNYHDTYPMTQSGHGTQTVGYAGGRQQFAIDFTLHYNGHETADAEELIGTLTYNITFSNYKKQNGVDQQGNPIYVQVNNQPLKIVVEVYRRGTGNKFYLDGVNGSNSNSALFPNDAVKSLSTIFNRCGYLAGDEVYVVNKVTATNALTWNGLPYNNVTLYRYNGGHTLKADSQTGVITPIVGNENNDSYKGELLVANNRAILTGITLDGYYEDPFAPAGGKGETPETSVQATAPLITVNNGGIVELSNGTLLHNNYNSGNGGAVYVNNGGTLMMNMDAQIKDNVSVGDGAGVYMAGNMIVSDDVKVFDNKKGTTQNNVLLTAADKVITIGTDATTDDYAELGTNAKIGVTKELYGDVQGYTKVVNVESNNDIAWLETPYNVHPNSIIYHDLGMYQLEKFSDPTYLYWIGTWVTVQYWNPKYENPQATGYNPNDMDYSNIDTPEELAWLISMVNGENGATPNDFSGKTVNITADIDMNASIWVPIGSLTHPFKGTFEGNGHAITGMRSPLVQTNMAMFGNTNGATIQDMVAKVNFDANSANMGTLVGTMTGGMLSNVEAAGVISGGSNTVNMGGLVGIAQPLTVGETTTKPTIHSAFSVNEMTGATSTVMGGLVGTNGADLYNSYANVTMTGSNTKGGLVGINNEGCTVENCYVVLGQQEYPAFAYTNKGSINYCYVDKAGAEVGDTEGSTGTISKSGTYAAVKDRKHLDYMYRDNIVTAEGNTYANHNGIEYTEGKHAPLVWNGLLSVLNQWVDKTEVEGDFSSWYRPTTNTINGDLPILAFPKDNCLGNFAEEDGKFLRYSAYNLTAGTSFNNGLDGLFTHYSGKAANIFLYNNATNVENGSGNAMLFINEDAVLLQSGSDAINATVGVTFDNSDHGQNAYDYYGNQLKYDWHFMSTPLNNAPMGITYSAATGNGGDVNITAMENNYFPNNLPMTTPSTGVKWDLYTYFEPEYHWINLKRSGDNHYHTDGGAQINYVSGQNGLGAKQNETIFVPGKGYMMAISQDSYMSNSGVLNNGDVTITLTNGEPQSLQYNKGWNLVGNPYQAYLDLKAVRTGADASYYIYDAESGDYVPYAVGASQNTVTPSRYIHPHQGFFMYSANDNNQFSFTQSMATTEKEDGSYFRGDEQINYPLVNLFARSQAGNNDLAIIELNRPEIGGATKMSFMTNANFELSAYLDGQDYGLLFTPEGTEKVPVHFTTQEDGTYTLTWDTQNGNFTSLLLVDNMTGTITDMLRSDHYTFDAKTSDYASRFYLTYACTGVEEVNEGDGSFAFFDGSEWVVNGKGQLDIIDVTGRVLFSKRIANEQNRVNLNNVAPGVYMMRVSDGKDTMVQKIVVR